MTNNQDRTNIMSQLALYYHNGSKNHGCEAIVRGTRGIVSRVSTVLYSFNKPQDELFGLDKCLPIYQFGALASDATQGHSVLPILKQHLPSFILNRLRNLKAKKEFRLLPIKEFLSAADVFLSIGGDNYCYGSLGRLPLLNQTICNNGKKTILWGCSIEPKDIKNNKTLREDLSRYSLITTRESLTYNALIQNGINKNTHLFPDPAFVMDKVLPTDLPSNFVPGNTVGLNLSPLVQRLEQGGNIAFKNFETLMRYILQNTQMNIALIPHVIWENNNDLEPLTKLYRQFKHPGRVCLIDKFYNAMELKGIISQCRFMVAARTHASIAAYSTQVPTLVIGYSVKARGIARDIFGTEEGYVLPVQRLKEQDEVTQAFINLMANEVKIRAHYKEFMPRYIAKAYQAAEEVKKLL